MLSLTITEILYGAFALGAVLSGLMVISSTNPVHSIFSLILVFANTSALLLMIGKGAEFLALLFIIVYVGAIAILFLFVVMMLNIKLVELADNASRYVPIGVIIGFVFLVSIFDLINFDIQTAKWISLINLTDVPATVFGSQGLSYIAGLAGNIGHTAGTDSNIALIGYGLFMRTLTEGQEWAAITYVLVASLILFVAMIGAIVLTLSHEKGIRRQDIFSQIAARSTARRPVA